MTTMLRLLSWLGLALTLGPSLLVFAGRITWETHSRLMLVGMLLWFFTAPFWMKDRKS